MLMSSTHTTDTASPMRLIGQISRTFARVVDAPLRDLGLAIGQLPVLVTLKRNGALSQAELAHIAQVEQPSMAQLLNRMERQGLVERVLDPNDARRRLISLTTQAAQRMPEGKAIMQSTSEQALEGFSSEERTQLFTLLERVNGNLKHALQAAQAHKEA